MIRTFAQYWRYSETKKKTSICFTLLQLAQFMKRYLDEELTANVVFLKY